MRQLCSYRAMSHPFPGSGLLNEPHARLPAGLTKLALQADMEEKGALALQISALGALKELSLHSFAHPSDGYAPLRHLRSLTRLHLCYCCNLPSSLSLLRSLEELILEDMDGTTEGCLSEADGALFSAAIGHLTRLTSLCMDSAPGMVVPPAALTSLQRLRRLGWRACTATPTHSCRLVLGWGSCGCSL
ncbi:hypothetical protein ABPG75_010628 [Micractinium tetrahymenae]